MKIFKRKKQETVKTNNQNIETPTQMLINRYKSNKLGVVGLYMFIFITLIIIGVWAYVKFTNYNLAALDFDNQYLPPSLKYPFGTDRYGRNFVIRAFLGGTISLQVGFLATVVTITIGVLIGGFLIFYLYAFQQN